MQSSIEKKIKYLIVISL